MWAGFRSDGLAAIITDTDPTGRWSDDLTFRSCPPDTAIGATWNGSVWMPPPPPAPVVPTTITRLQALTVLQSMPGSAAGKTALDDANALVAASGDPLTKLAWAEAGDFTRASPLLNAMASKLWSADTAQARLDALFIAGPKVVI